MNSSKTKPQVPTALTNEILCLLYMHSLHWGSAQMLQQSSFLPAMFFNISNLNDRLQNIIYKMDFKFFKTDEEIIKKSLQ